MSVLDRFIGELQGLRGRTAEESLTNIPESEKNAFGFGKAIGRLEGLQLAESILNKLLSEPEEDKDRGAGRHRNSKA
jgi:hypothetical protein